MAYKGWLIAWLTELRGFLPQRRKESQLRLSFPLRLCASAGDILLPGASTSRKIRGHLESRFGTDQAGPGALFEIALSCVW